MKSILYRSCISAKSVQHRKHFENIAVKELEELLGQEIKSCGLFVDPVDNFLGASPDGVVDEDTIVEIKCPYTSYKLQLTPEEAIQQKKITFWQFKNNSMEVNKKHDWFYQIQGQLHIPQKKYVG